MMGFEDEIIESEEVLYLYDKTADFKLIKDVQSYLRPRYEQAVYVSSNTNIHANSSQIDHSKCPITSATQMDFKKMLQMKNEDKTEVKVGNLSNKNMSNEELAQILANKKPDENKNYSISYGNFLKDQVTLITII